MEGDDGMNDDYHDHDDCEANPEPARCKSCNVPYTKHLGIQGTCARLKEALSALRAIRTWATFEGGVDLDAEHLVRLCDEVLKGTK